MRVGEVASPQTQHVGLLLEDHKAIANQTMECHSEKLGRQVHCSCKGVC